MYNMIKSLFDLNENEFENIIASVGFRNIQMILSQYIAILIIVFKVVLFSKQMIFL